MNRNRGFEIVTNEKRKTKGEITLPTRGSSTAMAYDFYATDDFVVFPNSVAKVWTDVKAYMKENECLIINVRSSMGGDRIAQGAFFNFLVADNGNTDNVRVGGFGSTNNYEQLQITIE